ncbi:MAG TPA: hypothetical protein G4O05_07605 [Caldilineae bacterium]|nr:hypothetical protein [Caldilineae bacterium]
MRTAGWLLLALLLLFAVGFSFLIHPLMGLFNLSLVVGTFWWAARRKKKVDCVLAEVARQTDLRVERHRLAYNILRGTFQGFETEIRICGTSGASVGTQLTALSGDAAWSTMDIRNVTTIRMKHGLPLQKKTRLSSRIVATPTEAVLVLPYIPQDPNDVLVGMRQLARRINQHARTLRAAS